jgi:hypothetical protein
MRRVQQFLIGAALIAVLWACAATWGQGPALTWGDLDPRPLGGPMRVSLDVLIEGRPMRTVEHRGKTYLPVPRFGDEYTLQVRNHGPRRIAAVLSVDGLSVVSGRRATEDGPGYIVDPYRSVVISGWRRNLDTVAAFRFVDREESYAARTGRPEDIGVIGLVAFVEGGREPPLLMERKDAGHPAFRRAGEALAAEAGTGYGRDIASHVIVVPFERSGNRRAVTYYYDTVEALRKAGVPVGRRYPLPFADDEFAPPPPGDRRR